MTIVISDKSTKSQILDAYNEALAKLKEQKFEDRKSEKKKNDEQKIVVQAGDNSLENIVSSIGKIKIEIVNELDGLSNSLSSEFKKLEEIKSAIEIESQYIEDLYEIKVNAESLSALMLSQKEKKANFELEIGSKKSEFEEEMLQKKLQWKLEQENYENSKKERDALLKKERQREEEDYNYNLQLKRKKESDSYAEQKTLLEKELIDKKDAAEKEFAQREAAIVLNEKEFAELKIKAQNFPSVLENTVKETEKSIKEKIEFTFKHQSELSQKEIEGERNLHKQIVQSLENKIKEQTELIKQLTQKVNDAGQQVQTIAIKAIESSSGGLSSSRMISGNYEKNPEQQTK
jgi:hypothetical protein